MAYTMIAERNNETVRKQRDSALIVWANARLMESDGWQVVITDGDGNNFNISEFDATLAQRLPSWQIKPLPEPLQETSRQETSRQATSRETSSPSIDVELEIEQLVATELAAEQHDSSEAYRHETDEVDFESDHLDRFELEAEATE